MRTRTIVPIVALALLASTAIAAPPTRGKSRSPRTHRSSAPPSLVWHVETMDGSLVDSYASDSPINPASVVKVGTTLWALETLGPDYRFETRFTSDGEIDAPRRALRGNLTVEGSGDPDFQVENALLVAAGLNQLGIREVRGAMFVNHRFWMGWEDGSAGMERDPDRRAMLMGARLRQAWDPARWDRRTRSAWQTLAVRRGIDPAKPPRVAVIGGVRSMPSPPEGAILTLHRSKPLSDVLRRFNCFSNNDIERVAASIGPVIQLEQLLAAKTAAPPDAVRVETASGLGENRLSPRIVVRMMREFRRSAERLGLGVETLLPVAGCDPGTVTRFFPAFSEGSNATSLVGKTGTLTSTDGGISVLAGFLNTSRGELVFCVAAPRSAGRARAARQAEQRWLLDLLSRSGGAQPRECAPPLGNADDGAEIVLTGASGGSGARAAAIRSGSAVQRSGNVSR